MEWKEGFQSRDTLRVTPNNRRLELVAEGDSLAPCVSGSSSNSSPS